MHIHFAILPEPFLSYVTAKPMGMPMEANQPRTGEDWGQLKAIHDDLVLVLQQLDDLELHHAAAHVSTALDSIRRDRPLPAQCPARVG